MRRRTVSFVAPTLCGILLLAGCRVAEELTPEKFAESPSRLSLGEIVTIRTTDHKSTTGRVVDRSSERITLNDKKGVDEIIPIEQIASIELRRTTDPTVGELILTAVAILAIVVGVTYLTGGYPK